MTSLAVNPTLFKALPYDPVRDFAPIALIAGTPFALVVNPSLPVHSVADLIKLARGMPGKLHTAPPASARRTISTCEMIKSHDRRRDAARALSRQSRGADRRRRRPHPADDLRSRPRDGDDPSGKVRALGISTAMRLPELPDVPPIGDTIPGFDAVGWQVVVAPAATPGAVIERLHDAVGSSWHSPRSRPNSSASA